MLGTIIFLPIKVDIPMKGKDNWKPGEYKKASGTNLYGKKCTGQKICCNKKKIFEKLANVILLVIETVSMR